MRTLVAQEWIAEVGGSENVFEQICCAVPHCRAVCLWNDDPVRFSSVEETWLARSVLRGRKVAAMPFMGSAWQRVDLTHIDRVVVSSHAFSHHLASRAADLGLLSFAYIHSPARYVWEPDLDERGKSAIGRLGRSYFRRWDRRHASDNVNYAANSQFVAQRMADVWGVKASVIHPPVDIDRIRSFTGELSDSEDSLARALPAQFILGASRFVGYKNIESVISAGEIAGLPVVLVGTGPDERRLRTLSEQARTPVTFVGRVSDNLLLELYRRAALFVSMAIEDFGIMPVEAMACGTPVLVNEVGGARESVLTVAGGFTTRWVSSRFLDPAVVEKALALDMTAARSAVAMFSTSSFKSGLSAWLDEDERQ
jgi:glycosyltransferase involved in cell wall biosynthesis